MLFTAGIQSLRCDDTGWNCNCKTLLLKETTAEVLIHPCPEQIHVSLSPLVTLYWLQILYPLKLALRSICAKSEHSISGRQKKRDIFLVMSSLTFLVSLSNVSKWLTCFLFLLSSSDDICIEPGRYHGGKNYFGAWITNFCSWIYNVRARGGNHRHTRDTIRSH